MNDLTDKNLQMFEDLKKVKEKLDLEKSVNDDLEKEIDFINTLNIELQSKNNLLDKELQEQLIKQKAVQESETIIKEQNRLLQENFALLSNENQNLNSVNKDIEKKMSILSDENKQLHQQNIQLKTEVEELKSLKEADTKKLNEVAEKLQQLQTEFVGLSAKNHTLQSQLEKEKNKIKELTVRLSKSETNFQGMEARNQSLKNQLEKEKERSEKLKNTLSYRYGNTLVSSKKSLGSLIKLPYSFYKEYEAFKKDSKIQNTKIVEKKKQHEIVIGNILSPSNKKNKIEFSQLKDLKVAGIMDEFTFSSFRYECDLLQITPENWQKELEAFAPSLVFIESAWKGKDELWATKISNCAIEFVEMMQWCHENGIKTMFWNKEDPVHFDTFVPVAKMVDHVFTTDIDCVPRYKKEVGHNNVDFMPFAAQPEKHNPVELYDRKDAFNFAGSYYLRYPERQRDFASLIDAAKVFKSVDIYDRNFDNPHPHYTFPDEYKSMILGKLPFEEIDKAYKGYRYGINMNTIKQSQTMFARRVFELLASNTVVVSNFSRGVRTLFGDLVISSDNQMEISSLLENVCNDELYYKKFRLLGLRKVMSEHTYADRMSFIVSKLEKKTYKKDFPHVYLYADVDTEESYNKVLNSFSKQKYAEKMLLIYTENNNIKPDKNGIIVKNSVKECMEFIANVSQKDALFGIVSQDDYYGENYIMDLALASLYSHSDVFGKGSYYEYTPSIELKNNGAQYQQVESLDMASSLIKINILEKDLLNKLLSGDQRLNLDNMLGTDEFNYCKNGGKASANNLKLVDDLHLTDQGVSFIDKLSKISTKLPAKEKVLKDNSALPEKNAKELFDLFDKPVSSKIKLSLSNNKLSITTKLGQGKHAYIYLNEALPREEFNMVLNSQFTLESSHTLEDMRTVFEFQDENGKKISHSMNPAGETHALAIPQECVYIRFGLKLVGNGEANISKLVLGTHGEIPFAIIGKSKKLVLTKQYPSYDDIYKYGFLHSRVRAYKREGLLVDVFRINNQPEKPYREFEDIDVATGDTKLLEETLATGQYDHVLVHLIDQNMWKTLEKFIDKIKVTIWVHGAEIQVWQRREYEFERLTKSEIDRQKRLSSQRVKFWQSILKNPHQNINLVFVSEYFKDESLDDLHIKLDKKNYTIIHNLIDTDLFKYHEKTKEDRKRILTIRPYASRKYANDLSVKAVELLSQKPFFNELEFCFVGDGELFEETIAPLKNFSNVKIEKRFLTHNEIVKYHRQYGVFLTPTRMDSQGVSRDEAMSSGLVPITTNVAAIPEFVDEVCGIVVEPESPQALADAIEYLYNNPDKFLQLSNAASQRVRRQCGFEQTIKKEIKLI